MSEFGITNITRRVSNGIRVSEYLPAWTGVKIVWKEETLAFAGNESGRVMEIENPWGTQSAADTLLRRILMDAYLPFTADEVVVNPAAEMGDAVSIGDGLGVIFSEVITFDSLFTSNLSAPAENELDHEFPWSEAAKFDRENAEDLIADELQDPDSPISESLGSFVDEKITDIDSLYTRGKDHVEVTTDHMALVTGYDPHAETEEVQTGTTKLYIGYESSGQSQQGDPIVSPVIIMGAGNVSGTNIGYIRKTTDGLEILYTANTGDQIGLKCTTDGRLVFLGGGAQTKISLDGSELSNNASLDYNSTTGIMDINGGAMATNINFDDNGAGIHYDATTGNLSIRGGANGNTQISNFVRVLDSESQLPAGHASMDMIFMIREAT